MNDRTNEHLRDLERRMREEMWRALDESRPDRFTASAGDQAWSQVEKRFADELAALSPKEGMRLAIIGMVRCLHEMGLPQEEIPELIERALARPEGWRREDDLQPRGGRKIGRCEVTGKPHSAGFDDETGELEARKVCFPVDRRAFPDHEIESEWIWVLVDGPEARHGMVANHPRFIPFLKHGDPIEFTLVNGDRWQAVRHLNQPGFFDYPSRLDGAE